MKKIILLSILVIGLFIIGCGSDDLPPEPGAPGTTGGEAVAGQVISAGEGILLEEMTVEELVARGYAPPIDTFSIIPPEINVGEGGSADLSLDISDVSYIYHTGYYLDAVSEEWVSFAFEGTDRVENWFKDAVSTYVEIPGAVLEEGFNYIAAYSCVWDNVDYLWDCNQVNPGENGRWMAHTFFVIPSCSTDEECLEGFVCGIEGQCVELQCTVDIDCGEDQYCSSYHECLGMGMPDEPSAPPGVAGEGAAETGLADCVDSDVAFEPPEEMGGHVEYIGETVPDNLGSFETVSEGRYRTYDSCHEDGRLLEKGCKNPYQNRYWVARLITCADGFTCLEDPDGAYCG